MNYSQFLSQKSQVGGMSGFEPIWMPSFLYDFQVHLVDWFCRRGRSAGFADCGLGKTPMQLVWGENVVRKTNRPVLLLTPIAVGAQTILEGEKFGIECFRSHDGKIPPGARIIVANYERLHHFDTNDFAGVICDESSILKNFDGATKAAVIEFMRTREYRLLCTATAAPNDYVELGNSAEALGELGFQDMVSRFFKKETSKDHLGWGRTKYRMRGHAERDFWRWVCSWSRATRKPSDLGFADGDFILPPLSQFEHVVKTRTKKPGLLFDVPAVTLEEQREERRRTIDERCELVADLAIKHKGATVVWVYLNDEGDKIESLIPGSMQVSGSDHDEKKEEIFRAFALGQFDKLVTKSVIAGFGLNWQHCHHETFFPSHSWEQYYQAVRRCWRFGQKKPVTIDIVTSEGEKGVMANLQRKAVAAEGMFTKLVELMNDVLKIEKYTSFTKRETLPPWMQPKKQPTKKGKEPCQLAIK